MNIVWKREEPTEVKKVGWRTIVTKHFRLPDGTVHEYDLKDGENTHCIATVALTVERKVIVARQFRPGPEKVMSELPGGAADANEDLLAAAGRELLEETGYAAASIKELGHVYKDAYTNTTWHYFLATGCTLHPEGAKPDEREFIDVCLINIEELIENARTGSMTDIEGVFLAYEELMMLANNASPTSQEWP